jgi:hypothetical protein
VAKGDKKWEKLEKARTKFNFQEASVRQTQKPRKIPSHKKLPFMKGCRRFFASKQPNITAESRTFF